MHEIGISYEKNGDEKERDWISAVRAHIALYSAFENYLSLAAQLRRG